MTARNRKNLHTLGWVALLLLLLYLFRRQIPQITEEVNHTIGPGAGDWSSSVMPQMGCTEYTLPDITLPGSVSIPGGTRRVCFGG